MKIKRQNIISLPKDGYIKMRKRKPLLPEEGRSKILLAMVTTRLLNNIVCCVFHTFPLVKEQTQKNIIII